MKYDFLIVGSWPELSQRQVAAWADELGQRGEEVVVLLPSNPTVRFSKDVRVLQMEGTPDRELRSEENIESTYDIPSLDHLVFTERQFFGLSRPSALRRATRVLASIEMLFEDHSINNCLQVRGPETHRLLVHHYVVERGGNSIWASFSPFEETFSLETGLDGTWDTYRTINTTNMTDAERTSVAKHVEGFLARRRFYAHDEGNDRGDSLIGRASSAWRGLRDRQRPGRLIDQALQSIRSRGGKIVNGRLYPSVEESRQYCGENRYVFFPYQYPIESRLTLFAPQFYRQSYLIEYLARILPTSVQLAVKPHPNHPDRPGPVTIARLRRSDKVKVLNPGLNAHDAISGADAVVVTNNTVGFETLYHRTPLLVLGPAPYAETPAATSVRDLSKLPERLAFALEEDVPEDAMISSIHSLREAAFQGDRVDFQTKNVRTVIDSVEKFVGQIE